MLKLTLFKKPWHDSVDAEIYEKIEKYRMYVRGRATSCVCVYFFMYDVRIFSTFYIRTKLDFLLYHLSSLFFHRSQKRATEYFICFSFIPCTHTHTHITYHMQRSKLHPHIYLDLSFFFLLTSAITEARTYWTKNATTRFLFVIRWKSLYVCIAFHKLHLLHHYV